MNADSPATDPWRTGVRDQTLDMVKGLLVVGMLLIHAANLFVETVENRSLVYPTLLGFVSGSWLMISGYIIGLRYRLMFRDDWRAVSRRLFGRGWRLIAIFIASNVALGHISPAACAGYGDPGGCDLAQIFVLGDGAQAFEVLMGIGYVLVVAPLCLRVPIHLMAGLTLCLLAGLSALQVTGINLPLVAWMMSCGIAGIVIGSLVGPPVVQRIMESPWSRTLAAVLAVLTWCGTDMVFVFGVASYDSPAIYVPHVASMLWMLYGAGTWIATIDWLNRPLALLAHYSLFAYMGQMAVLRIWRYVPIDWPAAKSFPIAVLVGFFVLLGGLRLLSALRSRFEPANRLYLSVFG